MKKNELQIGILKKKLGFHWQNDDHLRLAMTHSSFSYESKEKIMSNQRLEFLGDAVLELLVSSYLYHAFPESSEGELTKLRAAMVCESSLARLAKKLELGQCLYMGKGEERSGGRERPSILADSFESLLGAIYLDQGIEGAKLFLQQHLQGLVEEARKGNLDRDYKTELQELLQKKSVDPVTYVVLKEDGPDHQKVFTAGVMHLGKEMGKGMGNSKKEAEQQAAKKALQKMGVAINK